MRRPAKRRGENQNSKGPITMFTPTCTKSSPRRVAAIAVSAIGAVAATLALAAPQSAATVSSVAVDSGFSFGSTTSFGTGCSYKVTVAVSGSDRVYFYDNGGFASFNPSSVIPTSGTVETTWTPATPGSHAITATQFVGGMPSSAGQGLFSVGTGINTGSACLVMP
ncbi:hypothetical protein [Nocardia salmonicida]|uniref:hypothetical protein n=1 Tax=Nocardia salmonicida TaxID=53431 RepID=UPI0037A5789C